MSIYNMEISFKYLLQSSRVLTDSVYTERDLKSIYDFVLTIHYEELIRYYNTKTVFTYKHDLDLYLEVTESLMFIFEQNEEYECCLELKKKLNEGKSIINEIKFKL